MLEIWADLYGVTRDKKHKDLIERYTRDRLFQPLLDGRDAAHQPPRQHHDPRDPRRGPRLGGHGRGALAQDRRGLLEIARSPTAASSATGSQTAGEIWTPPFSFSARLSDKNQEHCVVYNMMRLAD